MLAAEVMDAFRSTVMRSFQMDHQMEVMGAVAEMFGYRLFLVKQVYTNSRGEVH